MDQASGLFSGAPKTVEELVFPPRCPMGGYTLVEVSRGSIPLARKVINDRG